MPLIPGSRVGPYEITALIGEGGMGQVYRARDTKLDRDVALKVLPDSFVHDPDRLARFQREAKVLASLNHPNIAHIHGLEESAGVRALVMELVEGEDLAQRLTRGAIPIDDALPIAKQIAEALDAAHEKGIVHRDLKPANIKITPDGIVKVLDFGLAKAAARDGVGPGLSQSPTLTVSGTRNGVILGTVPYMSPEQARGQAVDKRTDIWAFGCLLYEMLTGGSAFARETVSDTLAVILDREPDWQRLPVTLPNDVRRLIERCLEKDSKRRLRDIGDARRDLDDARSASGQASPVAVAGGARSMRPWRTLALVCFFASIGVGVALWVMRPRGSASPSPTMLTAGTIATQLTTYAGHQSLATISPDGRSFAFVSDHAGTPDIWFRQVSGGEPVRLTNDAIEESDLAFAPDGESIYFSRLEQGASQGASSIWQVGTLGGQARKVIVNGHSPALSPDGRTLAYMVLERPAIETLVVSALDGSEKRTLARDVPSFPRVRPAWAPDGHRIAYVRAGLFAPANLFIVDTRDGREHQVTQFARAGQTLGSPAWLPDNRHLVVSYAPYSRTQSPADLAVVDAEDGSISRLTTTISESFTYPSLSADGSRLIATGGTLFREVWRVPLVRATTHVNSPAAERIIDGTQDPLWIFATRDGRTLLYNSPASGSRNLWMVGLDGSSKARQITAVAGDAIGHCSLSPNGTRVAFVSFASGTSDIWTQNVDGSDLRQLTNDAAADSWPVWSPDGHSIVYTSATGANQETRLVSADGGPSQKLIDGFFRGDWVEQPGASGTWIVTFNGTDGIRLIDVEKRVVVWEEHIAGIGFALPMFSPDHRAISVPFQQDHDRDAVAILDVLTRKRRPDITLPFHVVFRAAWIDDGAAFIVNRNETIQHIVLFDRLWEPDGRSPQVH
jgi:eukaryotic-like serine/threonine-protein kinase